MTSTAAVTGTRDRRGLLPRRPGGGQLPARHEDLTAGDHRQRAARPAGHARSGSRVDSSRSRSSAAIMRILTT